MRRDGNVSRSDGDIRDRHRGCERTGAWPFRAGSLRFSGGITGARGHVGDNRRLNRLVTAAKRPGHVATSHPVNGCPP